MPDLIRSGCLTFYPEVARSVGLDPRQMMRRARLPLACLDSPDLRIAVSSFRRLLESSAAASGVEDFGLRMAERGGLANLGTVAMVVREQATIGQALDALSRFIHVHHEGLRLEVTRDAETVVIAPDLRGRHPRPLRQSIDLGVGTMYRVVRSLFSSDWRALEVHLHYPAPRDATRYSDFFGCPVIFDSELDAIVLPADDMARPIPRADPVIARYLRDHIEAIDHRPVRWDSKVEELVRALLASGDCTVERVARHFSCDRRTIHRHLAEAGTSFSAILDAQRADVVTELIRENSRPLAEIAQQLGFSAQSALARWFRGRFGCSISEWRKGMRPGAARMNVATRDGELMR